MTLHDEIYRLAKTESELTIGIMLQVAHRLHLSDPAIINDLYETVIFFTGDWPEDQGWGSSDTNAVIHSYTQNHPLHCLSCDEPLSLTIFTKNDGLCGACLTEPTKDQLRKIEADQDRAMNSQDCLTYRQRVKLGHTKGG